MKTRENFIQFIKFGLVGVSNTLISYGIEQLGYYVVLDDWSGNENIKILIVSSVAFFVSVINSYILNNRFVFSNGEKSFGQHIIRLLRMASCYAVTGLVLAPILKMFLVKLGIMYWIASLGTLILTVPLNYLLNKYWAFAKKGKRNEETINNDSLL